MRTVLVHLNVEVPDEDERDADAIADALLGALEVGSDDESVRDLKVVAPLAEDVGPPHHHHYESENGITYSCRCGATAVMQSDGTLVPTATTVYFVDDIQAVEPDELPKPPKGVEVDVAEDLDSMGFPRVTVYGPTREAVIEYVREGWGDDDADWFQTYIVDRVQEGEV